MGQPVELITPQHVPEPSQRRSCSVSPLQVSQSLPIDEQMAVVPEHCHAPVHSPVPHPAPSSAPGDSQLPLQQNEPPPAHIGPPVPVLATQDPPGPLHAVHSLVHSTKSPTPRPWHDPPLQNVHCPLQPGPSDAVTL